MVHVKATMPRILVHMLESMTKIEIGKYQKDCECMKNLVGDRVVSCDEIEDTSENASINLSGRISYWLIAFILLAIAYLLLLVVIVAKYR